MANPQLTGSFIPTSYVWDTAQLYSIDVNSPQFKELLVRLYQNLNRMALSLNIKDSGYYDTQEFVNSQLFFPNPANSSATTNAANYRQVFRKVFNFGALPNAATKTLAHGITVTPTTTFTRIYGCASDTTGSNYIPLPYAAVAALNQNIELKVDATNISVITGINRSNFNVCYVILEWITM